MSKLYPTFRYLLRGFTWMASIAFISILVCVAVTDGVFHLTDAYDGVLSIPAQTPLTLPSEITAWIFALVTGILLFLINFRVMLVNGVSRKTFLLASLPAAAALAAALAIFNLLVIAIHSLFWPMVLFSQLIYPGISWVSLLLVQFAQNLLFILIGWFISLAYYRSSNPVSWAISLAPFVLFGVYLVANAQTHGAIYAAWYGYWRATMRSLPSVAILSLLAYSAALYGLVYLLLRRAPLKG